VERIYKMDKRVKSLYYIMLKDRIALGPSYIIDEYFRYVYSSGRPKDFYPFNESGRETFSKIVLERILRN